MIQRYDPQSPSNEWKIVKSMSKRRCGVGVAVLGQHVYAVG